MTGTPVTVVWIGVQPTWLPYLHKLANSGIGDVIESDEIRLVKSIDILSMDRGAHPSLDSVVSVVLEYRKGI